MKPKRKRSTRTEKPTRHFVHTSIEDRDLNEDEQHRAVNTKKDVVPEKKQKEKETERLNTTKR